MPFAYCCWKSRELSDLIDDLKEVFELPEGGSLPVQTHGSHWITKLYRELLTDMEFTFTILTEDKSIKSTDM